MMDLCHGELALLFCNTNKTRNKDPLMDLYHGELVLPRARHKNEDMKRSRTIYKHDRQEILLSFFAGHGQSLHTWRDACMLIGCLSHLFWVNSNQHMREGWVTKSGGPVSIFLIAPGKTNENTRNLLHVHPFSFKPLGEKQN